MRKKHVTINWNYPLSISGAYDRPVIKDNGLYCIYRKFGNRNSLIYIGKASVAFWNRIDCPDKDSIYQLRGEKTVRLGLLVSPANVKRDPVLYNNILEDVESALIWEMNRKMHPLMNKSKIYDYSYRSGYYVQIQNTGHLGDLPEFIDASKHECYESGIL